MRTITIILLLLCTVLVHSQRVVNKMNGVGILNIAEVNSTLKANIASINGASLEAAPAAYTNLKYITFDNTLTEHITTTLNAQSTWTIAAWFRDSDDELEEIFVGSTGSGTNSYLASENTNHLGGGVGTDYWNNIISTTTVGDDTWHHAIISYNGIVWNLYLDNVLEDTGTPAGTPNTSVDYYIGALNDGTDSPSDDYHYSGDLDEVCTFSTVLSSGDRQTLVGDTTVTGCGDARDITSCVAFYNFENVTSWPTIPDEEGSADGTAVDMESTDIISHYSNVYAAEFEDGEDQHLDCSDIMDFDTDSSFSISFWYYREVTGIFGVLFGKSEDAAGSQTGFELSMINGIPVSSFYDNSGGSSIRSNAQVGSYDWVHFVYTYGGTVDSVVNIYVNGTLSALAEGGTGPSASSSDCFSIDFWVGGHPVNSEDTYGVFDEIAVYGKVLTQTEVNILNGGGEAGSCGYPKDITGLIHWWNFENVSHPTVPDEQGSSDGTLTNTTTANIILIEDI